MHDTLNAYTGYNISNSLPYYEAELYCSKEHGGYIPIMTTLEIRMSRAERITRRQWSVCGSIKKSKSFAHGFQCGRLSRLTVQENLKFSLLSTARF